MSVKQPSVLMVIDRFSPLIGGAEQQCLRLSQALLEQGIDITVMTFLHDRSWKKQDMVEGIKVIRIDYPRSPIPGLSYLSLLYHLFKHRRQYDIIHNHVLSLMTIIVAIISTLFNKPALVKLANSGSRNDLRVQKGRYFDIPYYLTRWALQRMKHIIAISHAIEDELVEDGIDKSKITFIPNSINLDEFTSIDAATKRQLREDLGLPLDATIILRVGSFMPKKGFNVLLEAWEIIYTKISDTYLVSVGGSDIPDYAQKFINDRDYRIKIVLSTQNVLPYYQTADIFVLPSLSEGLSNALLEAQACGLPSVVTNVGGNPDIVTHSENGLIVPSNDVHLLAKALIDLSRDPSQWESQTRFAKQAIEHFSIERIVIRYTQLYAELIAN